MLVRKKVHWDVSKRCGFDVSEKLYKREPNAVYEKNDFDIL